MTSLLRTFLVVQWLRLRASNAGAVGSIPSWGTKILHAEQYSQENKLKKKNHHFFLMTVLNF